ncbi:uncharacterized protein [Arachis hypogaea]|uniref:uncharacterized protein n=1 Tax=Arachis hypogaea TaxID=3818 RepID=UPI003B222FD7
MEYFVVPIFHHGGHFVRDNKGVLLYINGKVSKFPEMDIDLLCFFDLKTLFKSLGYHDYKAMFWFDNSTSDLESGLHPIEGDAQINELRAYKEKNKESPEFELYFDHPIMLTPLEDEHLDFDHDQSNSSSSDDGYETTEDEPYRPPPPEFSDESNEDECVVIKKKTVRSGKKIDHEGDVRKKKSNKDIKERTKTTKKTQVGSKKTNGLTYGRNKDGPIGAGPNGAARPTAASQLIDEKDEKDEECEEEIEEPVFDYESETLLTPESSEDERERYEFPQFNEGAGFGEVYFELGMEFPTIETFKNALKDHVIYEGRKIRYIKNDQRRVRCDCEHGVVRIKKPRKSKNKKEENVEDANEDNGAKENVNMYNNAVQNKKESDAVQSNNAAVVNENGLNSGPANRSPCPWLIYCAWNTQLKSYQIKTYIPKHTCAREFGSNMASQKWVAKKLEKRLRTQPHMTLSEAYEHIKIDYNVIINGKMVYRALKEARERLIGNERAQYSKLREYLAELLRSNPGSHTILDVTPIPQSPPLFSKLYICLEACKRGFKAGCRKLIGLDGCFLKGYFGGQLLSAVGQDANNHFYVIAYAVVDSETKESWKWFLTLLQEDLGDQYIHGWNFISDQQKGLLPALKEVMPHAHHRNCVRHIWKNFTNRYKDKQVKNVVWECAKCTIDAEFQASMQRLKRINEEAWSYLAKFEPACWTKAHFSHGPKCDNLTNNMCEVWNAKIVNYRSKPILTMCEELRCYIMRRMTKYKQVLETHMGTQVAPTQQKRLDDIMKGVRYWHPIWVGDDERRIFEVQQGSTKVSVNLSQNKCTCNAWQLTGTIT